MLELNTMGRVGFVLEEGCVLGGFRPTPAVKRGTFVLGVIFGDGL